MTKPFISLCPEITRADAFNLMDWLEDEHVTRYLSDSRHVSRFIEQVVGRVQLPILTCRIPDDCIDSKRYPLFIARAVLKELIESLQSIQGVKPC